MYNACKVPIGNSPDLEARRLPIHYVSSKAHASARKCYNQSFWKIYDNIENKLEGLLALSLRPLSITIGSLYTDHLNREVSPVRMLTD